MKKQSVERGIWYIGGRRKRKRGGAFPLAALAAPVLGNLGAIVLKTYLEVKDDDSNDGEDMVRDKILLQRCINPKRVNLPNGRTFYTRYERVSRKKLPANVTIKKSRTIGLRRGCKQKQQEAGILSSVFKLRTKLFKPS